MHCVHRCGVIIIIIIIKRTDKNIHKTSISVATSSPNSTGEFTAELFRHEREVRRERRDPFSYL